MLRPPESDDRPGGVTVYPRRSYRQHSHRGSHSHCLQSRSYRPPTRTRKLALAPPSRRGRPAAPWAGSAFSAFDFRLVSAGLLITLSSPARDMLSHITYRSSRTLTTAGTTRLSQHLSILAAVISVVDLRSMMGAYPSSDGVLNRSRMHGVHGSLPPQPAVMFVVKEYPQLRIPIGVESSPGLGRAGRLEGGFLGGCAVTSRNPLIHNGATNVTESPR
jgi:hypothetical protein